MSVKVKKDNRTLRIQKSELIEILNRYYQTCEILDMSVKENLKTIEFILTIKDYPQ